MLPGRAIIRKGRRVHVPHSVIKLDTVERLATPPQRNSLFTIAHALLSKAVKLLRHPQPARKASPCLRTFPLARNRVLGALPETISMQDLDYWQGARYRIGQSKGHYESWFLRGNHPLRNEAFWIRYTIFSPHGRPDDAIGELWAIHFDGAAGKVRAAKSELPIRDCSFATHGLKVRIGSATLQPGELRGEANGPHAIRWNLAYGNGDPPMPFLPEKLYEAAFPKAKAVCQRPHVVFNGTLEVDRETVRIENWVGSENHNWGSKHTDTYAWGQVVGFDNAPDAFLECATARLKFGLLWTPPLTIAVMRVDGQDYKVNALLRSFRAAGRWGSYGGAFDWRFATRDSKAGIRIEGHIHAKRADFAGLTYYNPPGGSHACLNSKIAACEVTLERPGQPPLTLTSRHRAAFEILTDDSSHGIPMAASGPSVAGEAAG